MKGISGGKYEHVFHFDGKAAIEKYIKKSLPSLYSRTSILFMAFFIDNIVRYAGQSLGMAKSEDGDSYVLPIPGSAQVPHPFVDPKDTGVFVELLLRTTPGKVLLGSGENMSWGEFMKLWTEIVGRKATCKEMSVEEWDRLLPGGFGREYAESKAFSSDFGWGDGNEGRMLMPKDVSTGLFVQFSFFYVLFFGSDLPCLVVQERCS